MPIPLIALAVPALKYIVVPLAAGFIGSLVGAAYQYFKVKQMMKKNSDDERGGNSIVPVHIVIGDFNDVWVDD